MIRKFVAAALAVGALGTAVYAGQAADAAAKAPATFKVKFDSSAGPFVVEVHRAWAPNAADHFYALVKAGFYDEARFFRVVPNFMVQFGINGDPAVAAAWKTANLKDDPSTSHSNTKGFVSFATAGKDTRTTQVFINYG